MMQVSTPRKQSLIAKPTIQKTVVTVQLDPSDPHTKKPLTFEGTRVADLAIVLERESGQTGNHFIFSRNGKELSLGTFLQTGDAIIVSRNQEKAGEAGNTTKQPGEATPNSKTSSARNS